VPITLNLISTVSCLLSIGPVAKIVNRKFEIWIDPEVG